MNQKIKLLVIATISLLVSNASFVYGTDYFVVNGLAYADPLHATGTNCKRVYWNDTYANQLSGAVTIPATVTYNGTTYTVTEMGDNCFYGCSKITSVQLGANIQYVCTGAFSGCTNLSYIICKASTPPSFPTSGISMPFPGPSPSQLILYVADSKVNTYKGTSGWNEFKVVTGENDKTTYGITLNQSTLSLEKGKTSTLSATRVPSFSTGTITWSSSDTNVATVSQGTVTAVGSGSATITASCNGYSATCRVSVSSPVKSISLSFAAMGMERGQSSTLSVTYTPSDADGRSVTWKSSNTSVATVSNGTVTAVGIGSATITATTPNGKTATCGVGVGPASVDLGLPSGTLWAEMNVGSTTPSDPGSYFAWGETTTKSSYTWASLKYCNNGSSSSFSKYTTAGAELSTSDDAAYSVMGSSWKTPSSSELQELIDLCTIESTTIDGQAGYLMTGPNGNTIFLPKNGYKYASSINDGGNCAEYWSRTLSDDIGWANELHIGTTGSNITGFSRQYGVGVRPVAANKASRTIATAISMSSTLSLAKGNSSTITVTFTPSSVSSKLLKWVSDNNSVATVDGNGKVTAVASGTAHITATTYDGSNISKTCTVTVTTPVSSISLSQTSLNLIKGGTSTLTVTYNPTDADSRSVTWSSSNTSVATVSTDGLVTAVASGTATITATSANGKTATCTVTVTNPVTSISLSKTALSLTKGATSQLTVTYNPTDADNRSVTWKSSNTAAATVSTSGVVTAVASGTATITATSSNGKTATCTVTVTNPVTSISLNATSASLWVGETKALTVTYNPSDADNRTVTWKSSNTSVATISNGTVTAVAKGTATITATSSNGKTATCSISVKQQVTGITLSATTKALVVGETATITATATPSTANSTAVNWSTSNASVATVSGGTITAVGVGSATITATAADGYGTKKTCDVTVIARGDVDGDGIFDAADISGTIDFALGGSNGNLYEAAADYNQNGIVTVTDAVAVKRLAFFGTVSYSANARRGVSSSRADEAEALLAVNDLSIESDGLAVVPIALASQDEPFVSVQFDMILPEGFTIENMTAGSRSIDHSVEYVNREEGFVRVICCSFSNTAFSLADGEVFNVILRADESVAEGEYVINLSNIILVRPDITKIYSGCQSVGLTVGDATGLNHADSQLLTISTGKETMTLFAASDVLVNVYAANGQVIWNDSLKASESITLNIPTGVYVVNGQKVVVK